jgi:hypothetical protein
VVPLAYRWGLSGLTGAKRAFVRNVLLVHDPREAK